MTLLQTLLAEIASYVTAGIGLVVLYYLRKAAPSLIDWVDSKLEKTRFDLSEAEKAKVESFFRKLVLRVEERALASTEKSLNMDLNLDGEVAKVTDEMAAEPSVMEQKRVDKLAMAMEAARARFPELTEQELRDLIEDAVARTPGLGATGRRGIHDPTLG